MLAKIRENHDYTEIFAAAAITGAAEAMIRLAGSTTRGTRGRNGTQRAPTGLRLMLGVGARCRSGVQAARGSVAAATVAGNEAMADRSCCCTDMRSAWIWSVFHTVRRMRGCLGGLMLLAGLYALLPGDGVNEGPVDHRENQGHVGNTAAMDVCAPPRHIAFVEACWFRSSSWRAGLRWRGVISF